MDNDGINASGNNCRPVKIWLYVGSEGGSAEIRKDKVN